MIQVFSKEWFDKYQKRLLWLLNNSFTKRWFRWCMRIRKCDCSLNTTINQINPNSFSYNAKKIGKKKIQLTTDFRTHDKYSKRLYFAFKPLWYLLHFFDWAMLDRVEALTQLSFGFSTLTVYPDASSGGTTCDGVVRNIGLSNTWATYHNATAGSDARLDDTSIKVSLKTSTTTNEFLQLLRGFCSFDTSSLPDDAEISSTILSLYGSQKADEWTTDIDGTIDIYLSTQASANNLVVEDFDQIGTTSQTGSPITYANLSVVAYNDFTFNATGIGNVNKTGITKLGIREAAHDVANSAPAWQNDCEWRFIFNSADDTGTTKDPKLVITYSTTSIKTVNDLAIASVKTVNGLSISSVKSINGLQ